MAKDAKGLAIAILSRKKPKEEMMEDDEPMEGEESEEGMDEGLVSAASDIQEAMSGSPEDLAKALKMFMEMC